MSEGFPDSSVGKESACNEGDPSFILGSRRSTGKEIGYPLQYSGLENSMDYIVHGVAKNWTQLSTFNRSRRYGEEVASIHRRTIQKRSS